MGAVAPSLLVLLAARGAQGVGAALMMSLAVAMVGDLVPKARTGRAIGLQGSVSAVGTAQGPSLGGALVGAFGRPAVFQRMALAGGAAMLLAWRTLPPDARAEGGRPSLDLAGTALLVLSLGAFALSTTLLVGLLARMSLAVGAGLGVGGYVAGLSLIATGYALVQVANNAAVMGAAAAEQRGLTSALLALARNLGPVTGASAMGALFALGSRPAADLGPAASGDAGLRLTFATAATLGGVAPGGASRSHPG